jgi:hypothetical protein
MDDLLAKRHERWVEFALQDTRYAGTLLWRRDFNPHPRPCEI